MGRTTYAACLLALSGSVWLSGCDGSSEADPTVAPGGVATAVDPDSTATYEEFGHPSDGPPDLLTVPRKVPITAPPTPPRFRLRVAADGCTVVRSRPLGAVTAAGLDAVSWTVRTPAGRTVFGQPVASTRRLRYYRPGPYVVVLTAVVYRPGDAVSNAVRVRC